MFYRTTFVSNLNLRFLPPVLEAPLDLSEIRSRAVDCFEHTFVPDLDRQVYPAQQLLSLEQGLCAHVPVLDGGGAGLLLLLLLSLSLLNPILFESGKLQQPALK